MREAYYVYILECADGTLYTGYTTDIERRVYEHNSAATGARYTKRRRPSILKYTEAFDTLKDALRREREIKRWTRAAKLDLINSR